MDLLVGSVDQVLVDRMNYRAADSLYARHGLEAYRSGEYLSRARRSHPGRVPPLGDPLPHPVPLKPPTEGSLEGFGGRGGCGIMRNGPVRRGPTGAICPG